jgi:hypothetical protein
LQEKIRIFANIRSTINLSEEYSIHDMSIADRSSYLSEIIDILKTHWPDNRKINIICHGHSVPAGYFATTLVYSFVACQAYISTGDLSDILSWQNYPNRNGHKLVVRELLRWFPIG